VVIDTTSGAAMRTLGQLTKANEAGTTMTMRDGELLNIHGMSFHESAGVSANNPGTGASYTSNTAGYAVGSTAITLITGTGTILAGDVITFAADTNKYVVTVGTAAGGAINRLLLACAKQIPTSATLLPVAASFTPNLAFSQSSLIPGNSRSGPAGRRRPGR
jgi:hypothetical protein